MNGYKKTTPNSDLISLVDIFQKSILPSIDAMQNSISDIREAMSEISADRPKAQRSSIFPAYVARCVNELIPLRNKVSHRVQKSSTASVVGYVDAAIAMRSFVVLSTWWQRERVRIDYKADKRTALLQSIERSRSDG